MSWVGSADSVVIGIILLVQNFQELSTDRTICQKMTSSEGTAFQIAGYSKWNFLLENPPFEIFSIYHIDEYFLP